MFNNKDWDITPEIRKILDSIFDDIEANKNTSSETKKEEE